MLSHLVGAANRADIRRFCQLEEEGAGLRERLDRQQAAFREAVVTRDAKIQELRRSLIQQVAAQPSGIVEHDATLRQLVMDLQRQLAREARRSSVLAERLMTARTAVAEERSARLHSECENEALRRELEAIASVTFAVGEDRAVLPPVRQAVHSAAIRQRHLPACGLKATGGEPNGGSRPLISRRPPSRRMP